MAGGAIAIYPANYWNSQPMITYTGIFGAGPSVEGFGKPVALEVVFLAPGKTVGDTTGLGGTANISIGISKSQSFNTSGELVATQVGGAANVGASGAATFTFTNSDIRSWVAYVSDWLETKLETKPPMSGWWTSPLTNYALNDSTSDYTISGTDRIGGLMYIAQSYLLEPPQIGDGRGIGGLPDVARQYMNLPLTGIAAENRNPGGQVFTPAESDVLGGFRKSGSDNLGRTIAPDTRLADAGDIIGGGAVASDLAGIPNLQGNRQFSDFSGSELEQQLQGATNDVRSVNDVIAKYYDGISNSSQIDPWETSTRLTFDNGLDGRAPDIVDWQESSPVNIGGAGGWGGFDWPGGGGSGWPGGGSGWTPGGWTPGGGTPGGGYGGYPVVLDLTGQGIHVTPRGTSNQYFNMAGDGYQHATAWAGAGNGVLVLDLNGNGVIDQANQVNFTLWDPTATSDMEALLDVFDTNHDGKLNAGDTDWTKFKVLVTNADGTTQLETLQQLGITSIDLTGNNQKRQLSDGSSINGTTTYTRADGTTGTAADVTFSYDASGYRVVKTVSAGADGSTTIDNKAYSSAGSLAQETTSTTSADGAAVTIRRDSNGDGVVDVTEIDVTTHNADGSTTLTVTSFQGTGSHVLGRTVTTTSADLKTITIGRDTTGGGTFDQTENDAWNAAGDLSVTVSHLSANGSIQAKTVSTTSADGLSKTLQVDSTGSGVFDLTETDVTVVGSDRSRTETVTDSNTDGSLRQRTVTFTSSDHRTKTRQVDADGNGSVDLVRLDAIVVNVDGSTLSTQRESNGDGSLRDQVLTTQSADGLSKVTQTDADGNGVFEKTTTDVTVVNGDGSRTEIVTSRNADGSLRAKTVTTRSQDSKTFTAQADTNGDGAWDAIETVALNASGASVDTVSLYNHDDSLRSRTVTTTSADGRSVTTLADVDGDGAADRSRTDVTVLNGGGGSTETVAEFSANGNLLDRTVITISSDGLSKTTQFDPTGAGSFIRIETDVTAVAADGGSTETLTATNGNGSLRAKTVTTISSDRRTTAQQIDADGDGHVDQTITKVLNADGSSTATVADYAATGALLDRTVVTTSASGQSVTTQKDTTGSGVFNQSRTDVTVLNVDGSRTETVSDFSANGTLLDKTIVTKSANGLSVTTQQDSTGSGTFDRRRTDVVALNADGSSTETIVDLAANGALLDKTVVTKSASGLSVTTKTDRTGSGSFDQTRTDVTVLNADGSRTETVSDFSASGALLDKRVVSTSVDGGTVTTSVDADGDGRADQTEVDLRAASGAVVKTSSDYAANGLLKDRLIETTSASGLSVISQYDSNGDGLVDKTRTDVTVLNADGSRTETITNLNSSGGLIDKAVITTSASGLSKTTQEDVTGAGSFSLIETDVTVLSADGSSTETVTDTTGTGAPRRKIMTSVSSDGRTKSVSRDVDGNGVIDQSVTTVVNADGSTVSTVADFKSDGTFKDRAIVTTSANGLSVTTQRDTTGTNTFDQTRTDVTVLNADGSRTKTTSDFSGTTLRDRVITSSSANGLSKLTQWDLNGDGSVDETQSSITVLNADGSRVQTTSTYDVHGALVESFVETTSANGLSKTTQWVSGGAIGSQTLSDITVLNADGSTTETVTAAGESVLVTTTSANGQQQTISYDTNADGVVDKTRSVIAVGNADGSSTEAVAEKDGHGNLIDRSIKATSADHRTVTTLRDADGDGIVDQSEADTTAVDGSVNKLITDLSSSGAVLDRTIIDVSADGLTTTTRWQFTGSGVTDRTRSDVIVKNADGSTTEIVTDRNSDNTIYQQGVTTTSADGRSKTLQEQTPGHTYMDRTEQTTINADGSSVTLVQNRDSANKLLSQTKTTVSADGLTKTVDEDTTGTSNFNVHATTVRRIDGSLVTDAITVDPATHVTKHVVTSISADGLTKTIKADSTNAGWFDSVAVEVTRIDGSLITTTSDLDSAGNVTSKAVGEASANGAEKAARVKNYQDGTETLTVWDDSGTQSWSYASTTYTANGNAKAQAVKYRDGRSTATVYDTAGDQPWSMKSVTYNAAGKMLSGYTLSDDGTATRVFYDPDNVTGWSTVENTYNVQGVIVSQLGVYDDGNSWKNNYFPGATGSNIIASSQQTIAGEILTTFTYASAQSNVYRSGSPPPLVWSGSVNLSQLFDQLGSMYDYDRGVIYKGSNWVLSPSVTLPPASSPWGDIANDAAQLLAQSGGVSSNALKVIELNGKTTLAQVGSHYFLYDAGVGPELRYQGGAVSTGQFGATVVPIGAIAVNGGYDVIWKDLGATQYSGWFVDSSGNYVSQLTSGWVAGTSRELQQLELVLRQDLNGDGQIALPSEIVRANGLTLLAQVGNLFFVDDVNFNGPLLRYQGNAVTSGQFGAVAPINVAKVAGGYDVLWKHMDTGAYEVWYADSSGNYVSTLTGNAALASANPLIQEYEKLFNQDIDGDGRVGPVATTVEMLGSTTLLKVGDNFFLELNSGASPNVLKFSGSPASASYFAGQGWSVVGAEAVTGGYLVAWRNASAGVMTIWTVDGSGNYVSNAIPSVAPINAALEQYEPIFHQDLNGDGTVGLAGTAIETLGSTKLVQVGDNYFLISISGDLARELFYSGSAVSASNMTGQGWSVIGAEAVAGGYLVALRNASTKVMTIWTVDGNGNYVSNAIPSVAPGNAALEQYEPVFQQDLNGDGTVGLVGGGAIETLGSTKLVQVGDNYVLTSISGDVSRELFYSGSAVSASNMIGQGWSVIGAEAVTGGYLVAWRNTSNKVMTIWTVDGNGNYVSNAIPSVAPGNAALEQYEPVFHQDLNGDGTVGLVGGTAIETLGSTKLVQIGDNYVLTSMSGDVARELFYSGSAVSASNMIGQGWSVIGAEAVTGGYLVTWRNASAGVMTIWTVDGSGNYVSNAIPSVVPSNAALEQYESVFHQDLNGDGTIGPVGTTIEAVGSTKLVQVGDNFLVVLSSGEVTRELTMSGAAVSATSLRNGGWVAVGAEVVAGGYEVAWRNTGAGIMSIWSVDVNGSYVSTIATPAPNNAATEQYEPTFHQDINGDGVIGPVGTTIEALGSTEVVLVGDNYVIESNALDVARELQSSGAPASVSYFAGQGWVLIGAEAVVGGYKVAWKNAGAGLINIWDVDSNGNYTGLLVSAASGSIAVKSAEAIFQQDLNGDGMIGATGAVIEAQGATSLVQVGDNFLLKSNATGVTQVLQFSGAAASLSYFAGQGWVLVGAEAVSGGYDVVWRNTSAGIYNIWSVDSSGKYVATLLPAERPSDPLLENFELTFQQDINGDGIVGLDSGKSSWTGDVVLAQLGNGYTLNNVMAGGLISSGLSLRYQGAAVTLGEFGASVSAVGAVAVAGGFDVLWNDSKTGAYSIWYVDSIGNYVSTLTPNSFLPGSNPEIESFELLFRQDINQDGILGTPSSVIEVTSYQYIALPQLVQAAVIDPGASLEISGGDSSIVSFRAASGRLIIDHSNQFTGQILGFSGDGTLAHSNAIDLRDMAFSSAAETFNGNTAGGILTVSDGMGHVAQLSLIGDYTNSAFNLMSDGGGGTLVVDPPVGKMAGPCASGGIQIPETLSTNVGIEATLARLTQAMATMSGSSAAFAGQSAAQIADAATLQSSLAAAWHGQT
ncbi:hypothetical protein [Bradyrhizobium sp. HKCCYLS20291]|uniref:hypothetical protein n=1 Tax=Bradyrhizobium sp. HKCCYLS20291 TaxID=3420766 RepID=UPI003EB97D20